MASRREFAEVVREHQSMVYSMALNALQNREAAEDLTQDVFLSLYQNLDKLASPDHIKHWLARVTANRCIDEIRKRGYRRGPSLEEAPEPAADAEQWDLLLHRELRRMVGTLPAAARLMIILRYQEELELAEISRILAVPVQTVKSRLHRSLNLLRARMLRRTPAVREVGKI